MNQYIFKTLIISILGSSSLFLNACRITAPIDNKEGSTLTSWADNEWKGNEKMDPTGRYPANKYSGEDGRAISHLSRDIFPFVSTLTRDIFVYHWFQKTSAMSSSLHSTRNAIRLKSLRDDFWDYKEKKKATKLFLGAGLYAATDPKQTSNFGGTGKNWALTEIEVPRKARIWDIRFTKFGSKSGLFPIRPESLQHLQATMCPKLQKRGSMSFKGTLFNLVHLNDFAKSKKCFSIFTKTMDTLKINMIVYSYPRHKLSVCGSSSVHNKNATAFVITDLTIKSSNTKLFVEDANDPKPGKEEYQEYLRMYHMLGMEGGKDIPQGEWSEFKGIKVTPTPQTIQKEAQHKFFGCATSNKRGPYPNDRTPAHKLSSQSLIPLD